MSLTFWSRAKWPPASSLRIGLPGNRSARSRNFSDRTTTSRTPMKVWFVVPGMETGFPARGFTRHKPIGRDYVGAFGEELRE
jgi:hypothetical protein